MEYNEVYESYISYTLECKKKIRDSFFTKNDIYNIDCFDDTLDIDTIVKNHKLKMINIKMEHTMRMIEQVININKNLGFMVDLSLVIKVAVLYHDIGRIRQSIWSNTFSDTIYKKVGSPFNNHGEEGYYIFLNNNFNVDEKYIPIISQSILHHLDYQNYDIMNYKFDCDLRKINISNIVTGDFHFNDLEWQIISLIVQLVADIDKADILFQCLSDDFKMIRDYIYDYSSDSLENISKKWGISISEIIEYNKICDNNYNHGEVKIPIKNMSLDKLMIPDYMKDMFFYNTWPSLNILKLDSNWNFVSILWWRLSYFLNQICFSSTLVNIEESRLLERIYGKIPVNLQPLFFEAFEYAFEILIKDRLKENGGNIYLKKK